MQFYEDDTSLPEEVADFLEPSARASERLVVLLTPPHRSTRPSPTIASTLPTTRPSVGRPSP
ncbi:MAG: hypothetical protein ACOC0M_03085 [Halomonas sp.]